MIKAHFHPVAIDHNVGGNDAKILKEFKEPAWNFQVIRFIDLQKKDLIPMKRSGQHDWWSGKAHNLCLGGRENSRARPIQGAG